MNLIPKLTLTLMCMFFMVGSLISQGCNLPVKSATRDLTRTSRTLLSFVADADRMIFDIDAYRYTKSLATLSVFVDGVMVRGIAVKKGRFDTYFALNNLNDKLVEIKGHKASSTNKRQVKIVVKKVISIFNKYGSTATQAEFVSNIPRSGSRGFAAFPSCNGKAKLMISVTNSNNANLVVRVRQGSNNANVLQTFTLGGTARNFIRYIDSDEPLYIELNNTNPSMAKGIRASVRYTTRSAPTMNVN